MSGGQIMCREFPMIWPRCAMTLAAFIVIRPCISLTFARRDVFSERRFACVAFGCSQALWRDLAGRETVPQLSGVTPYYFPQLKQER